MSEEAKDGEPPFIFVALIFGFVVGLIVGAMMIDTWDVTPHYVAYAAMIITALLCIFSLGWRIGHDSRNEKKQP